MWSIILAMAVIVCAIGWLKNRISVLTLLYYLTKKGYTMPNDNEMAECSQWVIKKMLKVKDRTVL